MKLTTGDIRFSESGYASATVEVVTGIFPFLPFPVCRMDVSVPVVEGKAPEQYKDELLAKAREIIIKMYKEIVCSGEPEEDFVSLPFQVTDEGGQLFVHDEEGVRPPTHRHRDAIIDKVIRDLKHGNGNMLKRLGRSMGLLQVAAETEAVSQMCESKCERCRESILSDFDNPPFKNVPIGWISPGVKYLKRRI
ncbi:hypothetical protein MOR33_003603 [Salmonella enterica]|nr:hypothetical protein [Salmonella enterica]EGL7476526.1 hypothetical protein [Salmonella enterica]EIZ2334643.1 hypothetical protein [Salmonella enterica]